MYTAQNESEAVPSWRVYFFPTERKREIKIYLKLPGVFDHSKCSVPKNLHTRYFFFFDPLAHAVFFTHTQKHTHRRAQETQFSLVTCRLYRTQVHFMVIRCVVLIVDDDKKRISPPPPKRTSIGRSASRRGW